MIIEFLIIKVTLEGVLKHCNKILQETEKNESMRLLKFKLMELQLEHETGNLDAETFKKMETEIVNQIIALSQDQSSLKS